MHVTPCLAGPDEDPSPALSVAPKRPVNTFSIVARDEKTGYLGVAVESHWFSVGPLVPWARAGVGAVATQSFVRVDYGPEGLALMESGVPAPEALSRLLAADDGRAVRQVAMIDAKGRVAAHTGERCIQAAGDHVGEGYSVQANLMIDVGVVPAMAKAYETTKGDLADRMLAALEAAQNAGGDIRGKQSAAILIVKGEKTPTPWKEVVMELRVEDHPEPVAELKRLVRLWRAYEHMNAGDLAVEKQDMAGAMKHYAAAEEMYPDMAEFVFWHAATLVQNNRLEEALPLFGRAFRLEPGWYLLVPRLPASELLPDDPEVIRRILATGPAGK
jgi:uncharacterized Ntn-hydrolase superfamily protein